MCIRDRWIQLWYSFTTAGNAANVVTVNYGGSVDTESIGVEQFSHASGRYDVEGNGDIASDIILTMSMHATSAASNLLFTSTKSFNSRTQTVYDANWTKFASGSTFHTFSWRVVTDSASYNGGININTASNITGVYAVFTEASSGGNLAWITA